MSHLGPTYGTHIYLLSQTPREICPNGRKQNLFSSKSKPLTLQEDILRLILPTTAMSSVVLYDIVHVVDTYCIQYYVVVSHRESSLCKRLDSGIGSFFWKPKELSQWSLGTSSNNLKILPSRASKNSHRRTAWRPMLHESHQKWP